MGSACTLLEKFLLGVQTHLPDLSIEAELRKNACAELPITLVVRFPEPLIGEIATRSRLCWDSHLQKEVSFTLALRSKFAHPSVMIQVTGWFGITFPELRALEELLIQDLGDSFCKKTVYNWWELNKDTSGPMTDLQHSKFRRVVASLFETATAKAVFMRHHKEDALWGYIHSFDFEIESLCFTNESGTRLTANVRMLEQIDCANKKVMDFLGTRTLQQDRVLAQLVAPSSINWLAALYGHSIGQPGADVAKMIKLFSAATVWGPGSDGWHKYDHTWTLVDAKNMLGRVKTEQGRTVWRRRGTIRGMSKHGALLPQSHVTVREHDASKTETLRAHDKTRALLSMFIVPFFLIMTVFALTR